MQKVQGCNKMLQIRAQTAMKAGSQQTVNADIGAAPRIVRCKTTAQVGQERVRSDGIFAPERRAQIDKSNADGPRHAHMFGRGAPKSGQRLYMSDNRQSACIMQVTRKRGGIAAVIAAAHFP